jgi:acyl carrier protein
MLDELARRSVAQDTDTAKPEKAGLRSLLKAAETGSERRELIETEIAEILSVVLKMDADEIDPETPFGNLGLDSLTAVELKNYCEGRTGLTLSSTLAWNYPTLRSMAAHLAERLGVGLEEGFTEQAMPASYGVQGKAADSTKTDAHVLTEVDNLTEDEALRQLLRKDNP